MSHSHHHNTRYFPKGFLWGTATSSHQVEGNNYNNDWWAYEKAGQIPYASGKACDHYNRYEDDFDLADQMNNNAHRLSIEWSRIEPRMGVWNQPAIEHYRSVLKAIRARGMKTMVTMHHFTLPQWFAEKGGFERRRNICYFVYYAGYVTECLGDLVDYWVTINEPGVYVYQGYRVGEWVPLKRDSRLAFRVYLNLVSAHRRAYRDIHRISKRCGYVANVGIAQNVLSFATYRKHALYDQLAVWFSVKTANHGFYLLTGKRTHDFLGINYYFRIRLKRARGSLRVVHDDISAQEREVSDMGWEIYPHGMFDVLMDFKDYEKPIFITENGVATDNDDKRQRFLVAHLNEIYHAIKTGVKVEGYFHWSLLDNFEWHKGFGSRFGLVQVNFKTFHRTTKKSGNLYGEIAKQNGLTHAMMRYLGHEVETSSW